MTNRLAPQGALSYIVSALEKEVRNRCETVRSSDNYCILEREGIDSTTLIYTIWDALRVYQGSPNF